MTLLFFLLLFGWQDGGQTLEDIYKWTRTQAAENSRLLWPETGGLTPARYAILHHHDVNCEEHGPTTEAELAFETLLNAQKKRARSPSLEEASDRNRQRTASEELPLSE